MGCWKAYPVYTLNMSLFFWMGLIFPVKKMILPQLIKGAAYRQKRRKNINFLCVFWPFHLPVVQINPSNVFFWNVFVILHLVVVFIWPKSASNMGATPAQRLGRCTLDNPAITRLSRIVEKHKKFKNWPKNFWKFGNLLLMMWLGMEWGFS